MKNWCCRFLSFVAMLGATLLPLVSASAAVHVVPADGTFDLVDTDSAGLNEAGTVIDLGAGATLRMTNGGGALSLIRSSIVATNGVAYLDLSALTGGDFKIIGSVLCGTTGGLVVKGRDAVFFGQSVSAMHVNYPLFDAPNFTFETAGGAGLVFVNSATLRRLPPSYTITPGARLALRGLNTLADNACWDASAGAHGTLTLTDFDVMLLEEAALPDGATVHVGPGRTFFAKPCGVSPTNVFEWAGCTGTNHLDLVLDADASFSPISRYAYALEGTVSGSGRIARPLQSRNAFGEDGMVIRGSLADFHGAIELSACREDDVPFRMRFLDSGDEVKISTVRFLTSGCRLSFEGGGTIDIDRVDGECCADNAIVLGGDAKLTIGDRLAGDVALRGAGSAQFVVPGGCLVEGNAPDMAVQFEGGVSAEGTGVRSTSNIDLHGGDITLKTMVDEVDASVVLLWLDASKALSFQSLMNDGVEVRSAVNGYRLVDEWHDCRAEQTAIYARNNRAKLAADPTVYPRVYPYIVPGGCNGMDYMCCGTSIGGQSDDGVENRRLCFWQDGPDAEIAAAKFVVMVFGSQNGGGATLVSDKQDSFRRRAALTYPAIEPGSAAAGTDLWLDGVKTNAATARLSGGWQVVSINLESRGLYALGQPGTFTSAAGGQNYAEVLVLSEVPSAAQRIAIERYLAEKWGLSDQYAAETPSARLSGTGTVTLEGDVELAGTFRGTVDLNGHDLTISALPRPPTSADVPSAGRVFWFDPDLEGAIVNATPEARPLAVSTVYGRDNDGLLNAAGDYCLVGTYATTELDRRPWVSRGARGSGPERNWLDFTDIYAGDTLRNALRVQKVGVSGDQLVTYRSGFYVLDSSNGGGSLLLSDIQGNGGILHRNGFNALSPIWSEGNLGKGLYLNNGTICLDGVSVAGTERGFSGRPEVMSFAASQNMENLNIYMGYINATPNCEVIGETMFYNRVLSDAERQTVEAYLMNKWLGVVPGGYSDLTGTTLTGAGSVTCPMPAALPKLGDGFTGSVAFTDTSYAFTIDATATPAVASSVSIPTGSASIPNGSTIRVDFPTKARAGRYALITAQTFVGASDLWLESSGEIGDATLHLVATATGLALDVLPSGTVIILH